MRLSIKLLMAVAVLVAGLAGCSTLPSQGPMARDVASQATAPDGAARYLVVDLTQPIIDILQKTPAPSFWGRFGDYRPAPGQSIGVGDTVSITIWEAAAGGLFTSPVIGSASTGAHSAVIPEQIVAADGSITVPYAGRIQAAGRTPPAVEAEIVSQLTGKAIEPQALVTVASNISSTVTVTGEVARGARLPLSLRGDHILDVIAEAGGPTAAVHEAYIALTRGNATATVPIRRCSPSRGRTSSCGRATSSR